MHTHAIRLTCELRIADSYLTSHFAEFQQIYSVHVFNFDTLRH
jgi:hypothetical protein